MNNKRLLIISFTVASLISCGIIFQLISQQCILWECAPSRTFTIYDLTIPVNLYPSNAIINQMISSPESPGVDTGVVNIFWTENERLYKSIFVIDRFGTENRAIKYFDTVMLQRRRDSYQPHPDILFHSQIADDYEIGCGISRLGGEYICDLDARYQEFVISFNTSIVGQMSEEAFEEIVISLDKQFEVYISP